MENCAERARFPVYPGEASIGSSGAWADPAGGPCTAALSHTAPPCGSDGGSGGLLSANATTNPLFHGATKVWLGYCSGDGFSGTRVGPQAVNASTSVFFGGAFILDAVLRELLSTHGMAAAEAVVLKGCSAGGASTFSHADSVGAVVKAGTAGRARYAAVPGAGFLLDVAPFQGPNVFREWNEWVFTTVGANVSCNTACVKAYEAAQPGSGWQCFIPRYSLPFITTPLFVANSAADSAQAGYLALGCNPASGGCDSAQLAYLDSFHESMVALLKPALTNAKHGAFLLTCFVHMVENVDGAWAGATVGGRTMSDVFVSWWTRQGTATAVDVAWTKGGGAHGGNPSCGAYGPLPSWPSY